DADPTDVRGVAKQAAQRGWALAGQKTATQVVSRAELEAALAPAEGAKNGVQVKLDVVEAGTHWQVRATAGQGTKRATAEEGKGWIAKGEGGASWYSAKDHSAFNRSVIDESFAQLRGGDQAEDGDLRTAYAKKAALGKSIAVTQQGRLDSRVRGLKLTIGMEPFTGVVKDKQIKTTVEVTPNSQTERGEVQLEGEAFPFEVGRAEVPTKITPVGRANQYLRQTSVPFKGKDPSTGFVVNMAAQPDDGVTDLATRYLDDAWTDPRTRDLASSRTAVVAGINVFERLAPEADQAAREKVTGAVGNVAKRDKLLMAIFGFLWRPTWVRKAGGGAVPWAEVRRAYGKLTEKADRDKAVESESNWREGKKLPYGLFRETVLGSSYTRRAVDLLSMANHNVHVLSQDADGGVVTAGPSPMGVLTAYTEILTAIGQHPLLTIGGYTFEGFDWTEGGSSRRAQLTVLANQLDRAVRVAVAKTRPRMLYPTEPNMLIRAWTEDKKGIFQDPALMDRLQNEQGGTYGVGAAEGRNLRDNLTGQIANDSVAYEPGTSTTTSPAPDVEGRNLTVDDAAVRRARASGRHDAYALILQSQSYMSSKRLAMEMSKSEAGTTGAAQRALESVYAHVDTVVVEMVNNPELAGTDAFRAKLAAIDARVGELVVRSRYSETLLTQAKAIAHDIIAALTAEEFKGTWARLSELLKEVPAESEGDQA
ncbi:hypothetical protein AB0M54_47500, partial [Actinoplanes sp. NPDC051470]